MARIGLGESVPYLPLGNTTPPVKNTPPAETTTPTPAAVETPVAETPVETHDAHGTTTETPTTEGHGASHHSGVSLLLRPTLKLESDFSHTFLGKVGTDIGVQKSFGQGYHLEAYGIANFQATPGGTAIGLGGGAHLEKLFGQANKPGGNTFLGLMGHGEYAFSLGGNHGSHDSHGPAAPSGPHLELEVEAGRQWNVGNHGSNVRLFGIAGAEYSHGHLAPQTGVGVSYERGKFEFGLDAKVNPLEGFSVPPTVGFTIAFKPFGNH